MLLILMQHSELLRNSRFLNCHKMVQQLKNKSQILKLKKYKMILVKNASNQRNKILSKKISSN